MAKATTQDIKDFGFAAEQFGTPEDWDAPATGFLARLLVGIAADVRHRAGASVYDASGTSGITHERLLKAEKYFAAAELWRRRAQFFEANMQAANAEGSERLVARFYANANECRDIADNELARLSSSTADSAISSSVVQSGAYPDV